MCPPDPDAAIAEDFWAEILARYDVLAVRFSRHLPDDNAYRLAAQPELGEPATLILPERWKVWLPPLPALDTLYARVTVVPPAGSLTGGCPALARCGPRGKEGVMPEDHRVAGENPRDRLYDYLLQLSDPAGDRLEVADLIDEDPQYGPLEEALADDEGRAADEVVAVYGVLTGEEALGWSYARVAKGLANWCRAVVGEAPGTKGEAE